MTERVLLEDFSTTEVVAVATAGMAGSKLSHSVDSSGRKKAAALLWSSSQEA